MNRIDRLIAILTTLQSKKYVTAEFIADKYEISVRTVYRDIKALGEIGVPISFENQKGYCVLQGFFLPPISLTSEEANALILSVALSEKFTDRTMRENANNALSKIKSVLRKTDMEKAEFLHSQIRIYKPPTDENNVDHLTKIQNAITNRHVLMIEYTNNREEKSKREIEPIGLTFYSNQWHLIAWCWKVRGYRDFKVMRIISLLNTDKEFRKTTHINISDYIKLLT